MEEDLYHNTPSYNNTKKTNFQHHRHSDSVNKLQNNPVLRSTDFASKGLYKNTDIGTKSQSVFKEVANLRLAGNTFDAKHMDRFLQTQFALGPSPSKVKLTQTKNQFSPTRLSPVRQSCNFTSIDREHFGQQRIYIDQYDGSSSLIKRDDIKTIKEKSGGELNQYDVEREVYSTLDRDTSKLQTLLYEDDGQLKGSKARFLETMQAKDELKKFKEMKQQQMFISKRDRILKCGWRHGILGVENPDDPGTDTYKNRQSDRNYQQEEKDNINRYRYRKLVKNGEVSSQVDFARSGAFNEVRKDNNVVEMYPEWKSKKASPLRHQNTHQDMFVPLNAKVNPIRAAQLRLEEKRDRPFNIISGELESIV